MKGFFVSVCILVSAFAYAQDEFPADCQAVTVKDPTVTLKSDKPPVVVLIHNTSNEEIWVTHPVSDASASAGWSSRIQSGNWSALNLQNESFEISCVESKPGHEQQIPCTGVISVCMWNGVKSPATETGTYWAGEDSTLAALKANLGTRGFLIPIPAHQ